MIRIVEQATCLKGKHCKHFNWVKQPNNDESKEYFYCDAFPNGIPREITMGKRKHIEPFKGDQGIQYENR